MTRSTYADNPDEARRRAALFRLVLSAVSALVMALSVWSMSEYVNGRDPLRWLPGHPAQVSERLREQAQAAEAEGAGGATAAALVTPQDSQSAADADDTGDGHGAYVTLTADDVRETLGSLSWQGSDVSLDTSEDPLVVTSAEGLWVEHRSTADPELLLRRTLQRAFALAAWLGERGVADVPLTWIEEDAEGTVLLALTLRPGAGDPATVGDMLGSCEGYAIAPAVYDALDTPSYEPVAASAPALPGGEEVPVGVCRASDAAAAPADSTFAQGSGGAGGSQPSGGQTPAAFLTVTVTVDASSAGAGFSSATVQLVPGSNALDALRATGVSIAGRSFGGGTWVSAIGGIKEDSTHGWVFEVDGSMPSTMSDRCTVGDGSSVVWRYVTTA